MFPAALGKKVFIGHFFQTLLDGKFHRAITGKKNVFGVLHDQSRQDNRVGYVRNAGNGAGIQRCPVHQRRIHFVLAVPSEHGPFAGIEMRRIFEDFYRGNYGIHAVAVVFQNLVSGGDGLEEFCANRLLLFRSNRGTGYGSGAAVNRDRYGGVRCCCHACKNQYGGKYRQ